MLSPNPRLKQKLESKSPSWGNEAVTNKQSVAHSEQLGQCQKTEHKSASSARISQIPQRVEALAAQPW